jgi:hypothetical protein
MISLEHRTVDGSRIERNILYAADPAHRPYYQDTAYSGESLAPKLRECRVDRNLYFNTGDPQWGDRHLEAERPCGIETRSVAADPRFVDPEHDNFDLRPDSPAHRIGFVPIPLHQIGRAARQKGRL